MLRITLTAGVFVSAGAFLAAAVTADDISARAKKLHFSSIVVDTHDDTTQRFLDGEFDLGVRNATGSIDIPRMKEGGLGAICWRKMLLCQSSRCTRIGTYISRYGLI